MIKAKYKGGSSVILSNPHDIDYFIYVETKEERREMLIHNHDHSVDNHYRVVGHDPHIFLGCYALPLMELVEGEEIEAIKNFSIFNEAVKTEYIKLLKEKSKQFDKSDKRWYHILVAYYMYKNGEMKLTSQQKEVVQKTHDNGITDTMFNKIIDYFNQFD